MAASQPDLRNGSTTPAAVDAAAPEAASAPLSGAVAATTPSAPGKKHRARIEHKTRGRIRMKIPRGRADPEILELYRQTFLSIPGIEQIVTKPDTGSIVIHYDPNRAPEFERHFAQRSNEHLEMAEPPRPQDEVSELANKIEAEAEFLAAHSRVARATVDFFKATDRELKLATGNTIDLKIVLALGLAGYTFLEIGGNAATPMWVTLALFSLNHFAELQTDHRAELARQQARA